MNFFQWLWDNPIYILWLYLAVMTLVLFFAMGVDKLKAKNKGQRIAESSLFLLAVIGGSLGGVLGLIAFRHKTRHKTFVVGFPLILILQIALGIFIWLYSK